MREMKPDKKIDNTPLFIRLFGKDHAEWMKWFVRGLIAIIVTCVFCSLMAGVAGSTVVKQQRLFFINYSGYIVEWKISHLNGQHDDVCGFFAPYGVGTTDEEGVSTPLFGSVFEIPCGMYEVRWRYFKEADVSSPWLWHMKLIPCGPEPAVWEIFNPDEHLDFHPYERKRI